jgi:hypothetical protein
LALSAAASFSEDALAMEVSWEKGAFGKRERALSFVETLRYSSAPLTGLATFPV